MATKKPVTEQTPINTSEMNVWSKLLAVRNEFYNAGAKKTGKNLHAEFMYFELSDIVPVAAPIFAKYNLLLLPTFVNGNAVATVVNIDKPDETVNFTIPLQFIAEPAKFRMNEVQGVGAAVTYYRRYLYMIVLDIVEPDSIDAAPSDKTEDDLEEQTTPKKAQKAPATTADREAAKKKLTQFNGVVTEEQVTELKTLCKSLIEKDENQEEFVQQIALKTDGFTNITASTCTALCDNLKEIIAQYGEEK